MPSRGPAPANRERRSLDARPALAVGSVGLVLTLTGFAVAGPTVAVPGAALLILALLAPAWVLLVRSRVGVEAQVASSSVVEGQSLGLEVLITGPRRLGWAGVMIEHELLEAPVALAGAGRRAIDARARGRGQLSVAAPRLTVGDPVGLARATVHAHRRVGELLVLPRTEPVRWLDAGSVPSGTGVAAALHAGPLTIDIAGLREYQPGTPATRIHWPALARGGDLLERVFSTEGERAPLVAVDLRCQDPGADPAVIDGVVRAAASLVLALAQAGGVELALAGANAPLVISGSLGGWPTALAALALAPARGLSAPPPRVPAAHGGVLYYACTDPALAGAAQHRWMGRMLTVAPPFPGDRGAGAMTPASPVPGAPGQAAVLEVAGCVGRPVWNSR